MNPIWVLYVSKDKGKTWELLSGNNAFYRFRESADLKAEKDTRWHLEQLTRSHLNYGLLYKAVEYRPAVQP